MRWRWRKENLIRCIFKFFAYCWPEIGSQRGEVDREGWCGGGGGGGGWLVEVIMPEPVILKTPQLVILKRPEPNMLKTPEEPYSVWRVHINLYINPFVCICHCARSVLRFETWKINVVQASSCNINKFNAINIVAEYPSFSRNVKRRIFFFFFFF